MTRGVKRPDARLQSGAGWGVGRGMGTFDARLKPGVARVDGRSAPSELDVDLLRFREPGRRPDRDPALLVDAAERLVERLDGCFEHVGTAGATAIPAWPEIGVAGVVGDMLERSLLGDEPHSANLGSACHVTV